jgi:outer membrane protein W
MKKMYLMAVIAIAAISVNAQKSDLKSFKVDVSAGYAIPGGKGSKGGVIFVVEPKYAVMSNVSVGLRMEAAVIARVSGFDVNGDALDAEVKASASYLATGDYYFSDNYSFRPFAGAGAGLFKLASASVTSGGAENSGVGSKFGGMIRGGIEAGHFRLGLEYNLIPKTQVGGFDANGVATKVDSKNGYFGIKFGACIGGGRR